MNAAKKHEREELELLLPWYVNGTLDAESAARVESALETDPALARSLAVLQEDREAVVALAEAEEAPVSMERRFLAQLDAAARERGRETERQPAGLLSRLSERLAEILAAMTPRGLALAAATASLVLLLQAGIIAAMLGTETQPGGFQTASGEGAEAGPAVLVQFQSSLDMAEIGALLEELDARIVDGPLPGGLFKLRFPDSGQTAEALAKDLQAQADQFLLVLPSE